MAGVEDLSKEQLIQMVGAAFKNIISHTGLWFREAEYQLGLNKALQIDRQAWQRGFPIQMRRLAKYFGIEIDEQGVPAKLKEMDKET
ncbi:MAG: cytosolic protein, partial [Deltaproteobacteria bacterium]